MKVVVCGYGLIGKDRVAALQALKAEGLPIQGIAVFDPYLPEGVALPGDVERLAAWPAAKGADWIIIATPHDTAVTLVAEALGWGAKVLVEKPLGVTVESAERLLALAPGRLWVGFNYRFFAGVAALFADARAGRFGDLVSARMTLGHGGAPQDANSWKMDAQKVGGGCLLDPGIHLLDLCLALAPQAKPLAGKAWNGFWKRGFDEEAQLILDAGKFAISLDCSLVRWRSTFRLELQGTDGYGLVSGRGRSYGPQTYVRGKRWGWQGGKNQAESEEQVLSTDCQDSFRQELRALLDPTQKPVLAPCTGAEALAGMRLYQTCLDAIVRA